MMTIEGFAEMTQRQFREIGKRMDGMVTKDMFQEGMEVMLGEIRGVRQDVRSFRVNIIGLEERIDVLEQDKRGAKESVRV